MHVAIRRTSISLAMEARRGLCLLRVLRRKGKESGRSAGRHVVAHCLLGKGLIMDVL